MIKLITIDLDGTLFDGLKNIDKKNIEAIKKARELGVYVVIATGRPFSGVKPVLEKLEMNTDNDYVICYNGAKIIKIKTKEIIASSYINGFDIKDIYTKAQEYQANIHAFRDNEELITPKKNPYTDVETRINNISEIIYDFNQISDNDNFIKAMIVDEKETLNFIEENISTPFSNKYSMVRSSNIFLEFLNKSTDKGYALIELAKHLNISLDETMAIGDAGNDYHMIEVAKIGVAMSNSFPKILKICDYITLSNEEAGVAHAINKFVLDKN